MVFFWVFVSSCCKSKEVERWDLSEADKQMIQYDLGETLFFIDSLGQAFSLIVTSNSTTWHTYFIETHENCEPYRSINVKSVTLLSDNDYVNSISMLVNFNSWGYKSNCIDFQILPLGYFFGLFYDDFGQFITENTYGPQYFYDSLNINNKIYYDVVEREERHNHRYNENGEFISLPDQLFYNKEYGILQMKIEGRDFFTIDN